MNLNVCRLCCKDDQNLLSVFDSGEENLNSKIFQMFGVNILKEDPITQSVCKSCCILTKSIYNYRMLYLANDVKLKQEYERICAQQKEITKSADILQDDVTGKLNEIKEKDDVHESITKLKKKYPRLKFPSIINKINYDAIVDLSQNNKYDKWVSMKGNLENCKMWKRGKTNVDFTSVNENNVNDAAKNQRKFANSVNKKKHVSIYSKRKPTEKMQRSVDFSHETNKSNHRKTLSSITNSYSLRKRKNKQESGDEITAKVRKLMVDKTDSSKNQSGLYVNLTIKNSDVTQKIDVKLLSSKKQSFERTIQIDLVKCDDKLFPSKILNKEIVKAPRTFLNEPDNSSVGTFSCQTCNKIFNKTKTLRQHGKTIHKLLGCNNCPNVFTEVNNLVKHNRNVLPENAINGPSQEVQYTSLKLPILTKDITKNIETEVKEKTKVEIKNRISKKETKGLIQKNISAIFNSLDSEEEGDVENECDDSKNISTVQVIAAQNSNNNDFCNRLLSGVNKEKKLEISTATQTTINKTNAQDTSDDEVFVLDDSDNKDNSDCDKENRMMTEKKFNIPNKDENVVKMDVKTSSVAIVSSTSIENSNSKMDLQSSSVSIVPSTSIATSGLLKTVETPFVPIIQSSSIENSSLKMALESSFEPTVPSTSIVTSSLSMTVKAPILPQPTNTIAPSANQFRVTQTQNQINVTPSSKNKLINKTYNIIAPKYNTNPKNTNSKSPKLQFVSATENLPIPYSIPNSVAVSHSNSRNLNLKNYQITSVGTSFSKSGIPKQVPVLILQKKPVNLNLFKHPNVVLLSTLQLTHTAKEQMSVPKLIHHSDQYTNVNIQNNISINQPNTPSNSAQTKLNTILNDSNFINVNMQQQTVLTSTPDISTLDTLTSVGQHENNSERPLIRIKSPAEINRSHLY